MADEVVVKIGDIDSAIMEGLNSSKELRRAIRDFVEDTAETWRLVWESSGPHPYETGDYLAHIRSRVKLRAKLFPKFYRDEPMKAGEVWNDSKVAHFIEYGTLPDKPGSKSPWGPNTPTPEFAIARRTAKIMEHKTEHDGSWE
jgi:hypothetical protein